MIILACLLHGIDYSHVAPACTYLAGRNFFLKESPQLASNQTSPVCYQSSLTVINEALHLPKTNYALPVLDKKVCSVCDKSRLTCLRQIKPYLYN